MDISFHCPHCHQDLAADAGAAGSTIECPTCRAPIIVPEVDPTTVHVVNPIATSAAARIERHFSVPIREGGTETLIESPRRGGAEPVAEGGPTKLRVRIFRHTDCVEVGHDRYEELVGCFLNKVGEANIVSVTPLSYTYVDIGTQKVLTDYAIQIIYRG